jgi:hypothetical protein
LEAVQLPFADPEALFPDREVRLKPPQWYFEDISRTDLEGFLNSCELTDAQKTDLFRNSGWQVVSNGFAVSPSDNLIRTLCPTARGKIYSLLARSAANYSEQFAFRFPPGKFADRFASTTLGTAQIDLIRSLTYTNGDDLCLSDLDLLSKLLTPAEFDQTVNALYRVPACLVRLRIFADSDINQLTAYWGRGGREARIKPMLDSLRKVAAGPNGATINVSYLLPSFARLRLYTFPNIWPDRQIAKEDCFWTSMNFFNAKPDNRFLDADAALRSLQSDCEPVRGEPLFGDLLTLLDQKGKPMHMCVYLADDFVFTKNGGNILCPWVIMRTSDMLSLFPAENRRILTFRWKSLAKPSLRAASAKGL